MNEEITQPQQPAKPRKPRQSGKTGPKPRIHEEAKALADLCMNEFGRLLDENSEQPMDTGATVRQVRIAIAAQTLLTKMQ